LSAITLRIDDLNRILDIINIKVEKVGRVDEGLLKGESQIRLHEHFLDSLSGIDSGIKSSIITSILFGLCCRIAREELVRGGKSRTY
jgi:hypothetical protein